MGTSDQALLAEHVRGRPEAFRELLERHAGLVYGVAWRVTGDRTMAEEVVQDVFFLLSRRAAVMVEHPGVVGWLHRTAFNTARAMGRRRRRHERKLVRFAMEASRDGVAVGSMVSQEGWEDVDEAIDHLPQDERAVVVLRYFQDLEYAEIAERLGVSPAAARKRLSRALQRLQQTLGEGRVASLAPGALTVAVPGDVLGTVLLSLPAATPVVGPLGPLLFMTQKQILMAAGAALLGGGLTWFGASEATDNRRLRAEVARLEAVVAAGSAAGSPRADGGREVAANPPASGLTAEAAAALQSELASEREKRLAAERQIKSLQEQTAGLSEEVVVSYGKVSEIGSTLGSVFTEAMALVELEKQGGLETPEGQARFGNFIEKASSISGLSREIIGFEDKPEEGSQFAAATYAAAFGLNDADKARVADYFAKTLADAAEKKLTLSNLPDRASPEFSPWLEQRWAYFSENREALRQVIPEEKRASFDQWVEKGGYGFKNLTIKGAPLMFSLGGDPR